MMLKYFSRLFYSSLARQLIFGIAAVHAVLMTIFVFDLVDRQRSFMLEQSNHQALGLASTLATNGASWVLANDLVGIEEIISSQNNYPDLRYAMFIDNRGKLLGYTDREKIGLFLEDKLSKKIFDGNNHAKILIESNNLIDVAAPIKVNEEIIGWARVGISRTSMSDNLMLVTNNGLIYTIIAILVGILFAWVMARGLTKGIRQLKLAMDQISSGARDIRCELDREDELGDLSHDFNKMLITIKDNENKIIESHEALNLSERKISQLVDNLRTQYIFYSHDLNGVFTYLSPSITDVLGYTNSEYMKKYDTYFTDNQINIEAIKFTNLVMSGKKTPPYEVEVFHKDGRKRFMEITESPLFDSKGNVVAVEGLARDITEIKINAEILTNEKEKFEREQLLLESIINAIPDQIYYKSVNGQYIGSNKSFDDHISLTRSQMKEKTDYDLFSLEIAEKNKQIEEQIRQTGKNIYREEIVINSKGKELTYDTLTTSFKQSNGELLGFIHISRDVTELRNKETQLRRSQKMDALGKLTGGIAHDYNNLLGVVIGYAELLSMSLKDDKLKIFSDEITKAGKRGANLTKKLLAFTRNQASSAHSVNINKILSTDLNMIQKTLTARIEVKLDLQDSLWNLWIDEGDFQDSVLNISINAMHAMPDGGVFIIKTKNVMVSEPEASQKNLIPGEYVRLSFTDTGCGMDEKTKEQVFDPFFSTKGDKGSGLGMSQVFGFVKRAKGHISIYSEIGKGSTIELYFKKLEEDHSDSKIEKIDLEYLNGQGRKILVVDDEPALKALASEILSNNGYIVYEAEGASEALKILDHNEIDLVLSDVIMPITDGYELALIIKEKFPNVKIVLSSGFTKQETSKPELQELTDNLLHKPYSSDDLIKSVSEQLEDA